ncbi:hypothetical protein [Methylorubrum extorquens]|uniref:hypothetical protein n=1 Tax=Methylorubrum extorquens TaxID=408 RepID=UPI00209E1BB8|nr:hypothetical protein [Methylorubrum extorquens]MCP1540044.1 hypothetical protein [Methylorubrum extorquens]
MATTLAACVTSNGPAAVDPFGPTFRVTLPAAPEGVAECLHRAFPEIPDRALTRADVKRIIGEAKILDRAKTQCGDRAVSWIEDVRANFARTPQ